jgi:hypothetical protein
MCSGEVAAPSPEARPSTVNPTSSSAHLRRRESNRRSGEASAEPIPFRIVALNSGLRVVRQRLQAEGPHVAVAKSRDEGRQRHGLRPAAPCRSEVQPESVSLPCRRVVDSPLPQDNTAAKAS